MLTGSEMNYEIMRICPMEMSMKTEKTIQKLREGRDVTIVALGDSLTYGWMVGKGYLDFLDEMLRFKFPESRFKLINKGIPGDTADGGLYRLREDVIAYSPDCVLIQFALNDSAIGISADDYGSNVQKIIEQIMNDTQAEIVLVTSICLGNTSENEAANRFYRELDDRARENGLPIARVHEYWKRKIQEGTEFRKLVQFDLVHPTVEGYRLMAEAVMEVF
jgi:acyl-CoA thioesterase-1